MWSLMAAAACLIRSVLLVLEFVVRLVGEPGDDRGRDQAEQDQRGRDLLYAGRFSSVTLRPHAGRGRGTSTVLGES